jgi:hypothetical protein
VAAACSSCGLDGWYQAPDPKKSGSDKEQTPALVYILPYAALLNEINQPLNKTESTEKTFAFYNLCIYVEIERRKNFFSTVWN